MLTKSHTVDFLHKDRGTQPMAKRKQVTVNRKYKDTVFRMLFSEKKNLLSLYNAISGTTYTDPEELEIVTLENAVYMGMKNDLAFIIDTNLFLYEHQSTYNPNMPLRDLFYVASEYQKLVDTKSLYSSKLQKVPAPKFLVFYNGIQEMEESRTECLSSAFENLKGDADLELKVTTLNIRKGHNEKLMEQCKVLKEYAQYVEKVRMYRGEMELDEAVSKAIKECIQEDILAEFLRQNRAEVEKVSIFEYDKEEEERKLRQAEFEAGMEAGREAGMIANIRTCKNFNIAKDAVIKNLRKEFNLTEKEASECVKKYW